jgi:hypothetical protein
MENKQTAVKQQESTVYPAANISRWKQQIIQLYVNAAVCWFKSRPGSVEHHYTSWTAEVYFNHALPGSVDEILVYFNIASNNTIDNTGAKSIVIDTLGHEKMWVTVMLIPDRQYWTIIVLYWIKELPNSQLLYGTNNHMSNWRIVHMRTDHKLSGKGKQTYCSENDECLCRMHQRSFNMGCQMCGSCGE